MHQRLPAARHAGRNLRRQPTRDPRLRLLADDASGRRGRPRHLRLQRPRPDQGGPVDVAEVNPSVPGFGGPTGVGSAGGVGATVYSYGNSELRGGVTKLSPKQGVVVQEEGGGWSHDVLTVTPGIPGDSGSGFLSASGAAFGVLSTLQLAPLAGSNGIGDLGRELAYMHAHSGFTQAHLVPGTQPFKASLVEAILGS
jgi:hypothetical protein